MLWPTDIKKIRRNAVVGLVIAAVLYNIPKGYRAIRSPELLETKNIDGIELNIVRSRGKNMAFKVFDDLLLDRRPTCYTEIAGEQIKCQVDMSAVEGTAEELLEYWRDCEAQSGSFKQELVYYFLKYKGCKTRDEARKCLVEELKNATIAHEVYGHGKNPEYIQLSSDFSKLIKLREQSERVASIATLKRHPHMALILLENARRGETLIYANTANGIYDDLRKYAPFWDIPKKSPEELADLAKKLQYKK